MTVYVDNTRNPYRYMKMCHMVADSIPELIEMARLLELKQEWMQEKPIPHFDLCLVNRRLAIFCGAKEITRREMGEIVRKWKRTALKAVGEGK